ncbi:DUF1707 domain-containing protein [Herbidospora sp. NEAU-GS84]|uniref:DUF1707 domain-containing protein n=1 Tax=Herbidospora solisilvae TaxID=2696284 RepID=A0A7C9N5P4_9ACTN|nr:DUF1707 domain-containing protein [Herbidospora solisilvae]
MTGRSTGSAYERSPPFARGPPSSCGRIDLDELNERIDLTYAARTLGELEQGVAELRLHTVNGGCARKAGDGCRRGSALGSGAAWPGAHRRLCLSVPIIQNVRHCEIRV